MNSLTHSPPAFDSRRKSTRVRRGGSRPSAIVRVPSRREAAGLPIRTLIVDDSPAVLKTLSCLLGIREEVQLVGTATDGYQALRRVVELQPDLVLMDVQLSGLNGLQVSREIKSRTPAPVIILVTADDTPQSRAAARAAGTDGFVSKRDVLLELPEAIRTLFPGPADGRLRCRI